MMTPQLTEQYGHVERVSLARAILSVRNCAYAGFKSKPKSAAAAPPTVVSFKKSRRVGFIADPRPQEVKVGNWACGDSLIKRSVPTVKPSFFGKAIAPLPKPGPCVSTASTHGRRACTAKGPASARSCAIA